MVRKNVIEEKELKNAWKSITRQVINDYSSLSELVIVGIRCRGDILASRMVKEIKRATGADIPLGILDITLYRDDFTTVGPEPVVRETEIDFDINKKNVILVDDVLFTGRTIRAAMDALIDFGRPASIRLAVLIDRGKRELPIQPDYVAKKITVKSGEIVEVKLKELDGKEGVVVTKSR
ncbi:MAG: bifunctional pyr operon transcriptional regulator/uracil phosphoribosyltransferase PyrR [bacterium]